MDLTTYPDITYGAGIGDLHDLEAQRARIKWEVAIGYRIFASNRWGQMGDGHITARDPILTDHFWVLGYGIAFHQATIHNLVLVGPDGSIVDGPTAGGVNHAGYHIHFPIYDTLDDVGGAAHTHTAWGTPFSAEVRPMEPISQESTAFVFDQALYEGTDLEVDSTDGGYRIAKSMIGHGLDGGPARLCILRNHGLLTAGPGPAAAVGFFVMAERVAEVHMKARLAQPIPIDDARQVAAGMSNPELGWRVFQWLARDLVPDPSVVL